MPDNIKVLLLGAGPMAIEHAKVLIDQNISFNVIGRGSESAQNFEEKTGVKVDVSDLFSKEDEYFAQYSHAINAVNVESLGTTTCKLTSVHLPNILVEKPGGITINDLEEIETAEKSSTSKVVIGYNRRFYLSVVEAQRIIEEDGGLMSFNFEFTEWSHRIEELVKTEKSLSNWFVGNSTHVVDTAFHVAGKPKQIQSFASGDLSWHKNSIFSGAGVSEKGALFSYHANWQSAGRWSIEFLTPKRKLVLCPMEKLQEILKGTVALKEVELDYSSEEGLKQGLPLMIKEFIANKHDRFVTIDSQLKSMHDVYAKMNP